MDKKLLTTLKKMFTDYWVLTVALLLLLILINFVILPIHKQISDLQQRIAIEKSNLETKYIRRQTIRRTLLALQHTKDEWPKLYSSFYPQFGNEVDFIHTFEIIADTYHITQTLQLEPSLASNYSPDITLVPMQLTLTGSFANVISYMHTLENTLNILELVELKISRLDPVGTVQADIRYNSYWQKK